MSTHNDTIKLKLAWQTAFELRTCPDSSILYAAEPDATLQRHLEICHVCRNKRAMPTEEKGAWQVLMGKFAASAMQPGTSMDKQAGQVWTIRKEFGGWREDGRFIRPPSVLLLGKIGETNGWQVAQLFGDQLLMGNGDVPLDDRFGFAEGWNCYSLKEDRLDNCWGGVEDDELQQVLSASVTSHEPAPIGSMLSLFRKMEIDIGAFVVLSAVVELLEEWEGAQQTATVNGWLEQMLGSLSRVRERVQKVVDDWHLPQSATSAFEYLTSARPRQDVPLLAADAGVVKTLNLVREQPDGILIKAIVATITNDDPLDDGSYFIAGKLSEASDKTLHLLASLVVNNAVIAESQSQVNPGSLYFSVEFGNVSHKACTLENVKMLLVSQ